jgi:hypothetical protein
MRTSFTDDYTFGARTLEATLRVVRPRSALNDLVARGRRQTSCAEWRSIMKQDPIRLGIEELEQRIAPDVIGNPGNNAPGTNNTNNPGSEGGGGTNPVPAGATPQPNP